MLAVFWSTINVPATVVSIVVSTVSLVLFVSTIYFQSSMIISASIWWVITMGALLHQYKHTFSSEVWHTLNTLCILG